MLKKYFGKKYVEAQKKHLVMARQVLEHLKEHGPTHYDALYVLFARNGTALIQAILQELKQWKHIEISKDMYEEVSITASGLKRLEPPPKDRNA
jgi:hypothetical protein